jgi:hypothetical protein
MLCGMQSSRRTSVAAPARQLFTVMMLVLLVACFLPGAPGPSDFPPGLFGIVTNAVTNARVPGATVQAQGRTVTTDTSGVYTIEKLQAGTFPVKVTHPDYIDTQRDVAISDFLSPGDFALQPKT